ncbi:MAG TPA: serine/threonine-protein kinase [Gemmatimonadota bacterium]|nr:serine/threonine-protein kinase [Gemmatimonadota bacterium]
MLPPLLVRLRAALAQKYDVERELGAGGMGTVFLARDVTLERPVALKILRPEFATAAAAERFLREARILAGFNHPNIVPVHSAGEADGLFYYVMELVQGETLEQRLRRGPLGAAEVVRLGCDLLSALKDAHEHGIIHRDIKPGNVFLVDERALLGDFGLAKAVDEESPPLTEPGRQLGTPAYMPPEQVSGAATRRTDIYALGMLLYEAVTGRRWSIATPSDEADWSGVPPRLVPALRTALAWSPDDRWESAPAFSEALCAEKRAVGSRRARRAVLLGAAVAAVAIVSYWVLGPSRPADALSDLAILPISVRGPRAPELDGEELAYIVRDKLKMLPDVRIVPTTISFPWYRSPSRPGAEREEQAASELNARYAVGATIVAEANGLAVELRVFDARGRGHPESGEILLQSMELGAVSDSLTRRLQTVLLGDEGHEVRRLTRDPLALNSFALGEKAFERGQWVLARDHYERAVARDSSFILAWWQLANAHRWLPERGPYDADFGRLFSLHAGALGPLDSMLMAAQLTPAGAARLAAYRETHRRYPQDDYAAFLLGEELFNRGPLWGESLESAANVLEGAVAVRSSWADTYLLLAWAYIRLGRGDDAARVLQVMPPVVAGPEEGWQLPPELVHQAYRERFAPEQGGQSLLALMSDTEFGSLEWLAPLARLAGAFDLPRAQVTLGQLLGERAPLAPLQAGGQMAVGLGYAALGMADSALVAFDSSVALFGTVEARLQAAQWRVLPGALGISMVAPAEVERGRQMLAGLQSDSAVSRQALWTLAMDAYAAGDTLEGRRLARRLADGASADRPSDGLIEFLQAMDMAASGRLQEALELSEGLLAMQAMTRQLKGGAEPPGQLAGGFTRAALHLERGKWHARLGNDESADREWLWYEAVDVDGLPVAEPAQAGELDWALGVYGRYLRGMTAFESGEFSGACRHLGRVTELWSNPAAELAPLARAASARANQACDQLGTD